MFPTSSLNRGMDNMGFFASMASNEGSMAACAEAAMRRGRHTRSASASGVWGRCRPSQAAASPPHGAALRSCSTCSAASPEYSTPDGRCGAGRIGGQSTPFDLHHLQSGTRSAGSIALAQRGITATVPWDLVTDSGASTPGAKASSVAFGAREGYRDIATVSDGGGCGALSVMRRDMEESVDGRCVGQLMHFQESNNCAVEEALRMLETKVTSLVGAQPMLDWKVSELSSSVKGIKEELERQIQRGDALESRLHRWSQTVHDEIPDFRRQQRPMSGPSYFMPTSMGGSAAVTAADDSDLNQTLPWTRCSLQQQLNDGLEQVRQEIGDLVADAVATKMQVAGAWQEESASVHARLEELADMHSQGFEDFSDRASQVEVAVADVRRTLKSLQEDLFTMATIFGGGAKALTRAEVEEIFEQFFDMAWLDRSSALKKNILDAGQLLEPVQELLRSLAALEDRTADTALAISTLREVTAGGHKRLEELREETAGGHKRLEELATSAERSCERIHAMEQQHDSLHEQLHKLRTGAKADDGKDCFTSADSAWGEEAVGSAHHGLPEHTQSREENAMSMNGQLSRETPSPAFHSGRGLDEMIRTEVNVHAVLGEQHKTAVNPPRLLAKLASAMQALGDEFREESAAMWCAFGELADIVGTDSLRFVPKSPDAKCRAMRDAQIPGSALQRSAIAAGHCSSDTSNEIARLSLVLSRLRARLDESDQSLRKLQATSSIPTHRELSQQVADFNITAEAVPTRILDCPLSDSVTFALSTAMNTERLASACDAGTSSEHKKTLEAELQSGASVTNAPTALIGSPHVFSSQPHTDAGEPTEVAVGRRHSVASSLGHVDSDEEVAESVATTSTVSCTPFRSPSRTRGRDVSVPESSEAYHSWQRHSPDLAFGGGASGAASQSVASQHSIHRRERGSPAGCSANPSDRDLWDRIANVVSSHGSNTKGSGQLRKEHHDTEMAGQSNSPPPRVLRSFRHLGAEAATGGAADEVRQSADHAVQGSGGDSR